MRAIAVLLVVLYHSSAAPFRHGYVGVDIFFVISGFVITNLVSRELAEGRFSIAHFALRRLQRLAPALCTMLLILLIAGYFVVGPDQYSELARESVYSSLFVSNYYFLSHTGYFDLAARKLALLHTWSVSVEVQLYALLVLALWLACRVAKRTTDKRRLIVTLLMLLAFASLLATVAVGTHDLKTVYYGPQFRGWEFVSGGLLSFLPRASRARPLIAWLGAAAVLAAAAFNAPEGLAAYVVRLAVVCAGTCCLLLGCATGETRLARFLSTRPLVALGRLSYSYYLWHWPTLVIARYYVGVDERSVSVNVAAPLVSLALAAVTLRFVEQPLRYAHVRAGPAWAGLTCALALVVGVALMVTSTNGFISRFDPRLLALRSKQAMWDWQCPQEIEVSVSHRSSYVCGIGAPWKSATTHGVLWGDSHALQLAPLLDILARKAEASFAIWSACAPYIDGVRIQIQRPTSVEQRWYNAECTRNRERGLAWIGSNDEPLIIVIAQAWSVHPNQLLDTEYRGSARQSGIDLFQRGLKDFLNDARIRKQRIWLIGDVPSSDYDIADCYIRSVMRTAAKPCERNPSLLSWQDVAAGLDSTNEILRSLADGFPNVHTLILSDRMCAGAGCITTVGGELIYRDSDHLRRNLPPETQRELIELLNLGEIIHIEDGHVGTQLAPQ
jgi:peptidoglycan/LPS O-acetylase OafA/YrhL